MGTWLGRVAFALGIVAATSAWATPGDQLAMAFIGGLLISVGAWWGWDDR